MIEINTLISTMFERKQMYGKLYLYFLDFNLKVPTLINSLLKNNALFDKRLVSDEYFYYIMRLMLCIIEFKIIP